MPGKHPFLPASVTVKPGAAKLILSLTAPQKWRSGSSFDVIPIVFVPVTRFDPPGGKTAVFIRRNQRGTGVDNPFCVLPSFSEILIPQSHSLQDCAVYPHRSPFLRQCSKHNTAAERFLRSAPEAHPLRAASEDHRTHRAAAPCRRGR